MKAESFISDKAYQHSCIFRTVIFVVGVGSSFGKSRVPFLFWSKSIAKVLGVSSLKWFGIPDSWEKLPFPLYLSQFRSQLKTRCNKKRRFSFRKEQERKPLIIIGPIRYKNHRHYRPHPLLSLTRKVIGKVLEVICGTISPTPPSS